MNILNMLIVSSNFSVFFSWFAQHYNVGHGHIMIICFLKTFYSTQGQRRKGEPPSLPDGGARLRSTALPSLSCPKRGFQGSCVPIMCSGNVKLYFLMWPMGVSDAAGRDERPGGISWFPLESCSAPDPWWKLSPQCLGDNDTQKGGYGQQAPYPML